MQLWNIEPPKKVIFACLMAIFLMTMIPLPARAAVHNLAIVSVEPALSLVAPGGSVNVTATIENLGTVPMNATTQLQFFYRDYESGTEGTGDDTPWGTWFAQVGYVAILNAGENASYTVTWDVPAWLTPGDYQIRAGFPYAWVDDDPSDNTLLSDKVTVAVHNLAIVSVEPALSLVAPGGSVNVTATIENLGTVPMNATTQLQFFYRDYESGTEGTGDDTPWGTWFAQVGYVAILNAGENASYTVTWDVPAWLTPGDYQIRAGFPYAWVDDDPSDNTLLSDKVTVEPPPPAVGGKASPIIIAITNLGLLAPLIGLAALITLVAVSIIYVKHKKKKQT